MRYEIVSPTTGEVMTLGYPEWLRLLALASCYGGLPGEGPYHYYEEEGAVIPEETAGDMAEALAYFAGELRAAISGFVRMGRTGELEVTQHRS